jgi:Flp pilus assembly pilin Flp
MTPGEEMNMNLIYRFKRDESGASSVEYALLVAFVAVAIAATVQTFGAAVKGLFDRANNDWPQ